MAFTKYIWDPLSDNVLMEKDENGDTTAAYTHLPELHGELISQSRGGVESFYHYDGEGNTRALTDINGDVTDTYDYDAFGDVTANTGNTTNPFGFKGALGYYANPETNDYYVRARNYEPTIARWLSADPIGFEDGMNLYAYVTNDPVNNVDPSGLANGKSTRLFILGLTPEGLPIVYSAKEKTCFSLYLTTWPTEWKTKTVECPENAGGTVVPRTAGKHMNCSGPSTGIRKNINWPGLGENCSDEKFRMAKDFVPNGCIETTCDHLKQRDPWVPSYVKGPCDCTKYNREVIVFLYRYPEEGRPVCDFHMLGRPCETGQHAAFRGYSGVSPGRTNPNFWCTKLGTGSEVFGVGNPEHNLLIGYGKFIEKVAEGDRVTKCYCCKTAKIQCKSIGFLETGEEVFEFE